MTTAAIDPELLHRGGLALDVDGPRATIRLARPEVLNAQMPATWEALRSIGDALPDEVRVVVVRGEGRAFSAGLDKRFFTAHEIDGTPGIAGIALTIGMAVDANFLIFERIREELVRGKTVRTAVNEGFDHAFSAIIDTHATTALTALVLYQIGTGPVQGFAVALLAGLAASLVSAVFVVRTLFLLWLDRSRGAQTLSI